MSSRSPFPGMDPWLERYWGDVHHALIQYARDQLTPSLPQGLYAVVERTVYLLGDDVDGHPKFLPDVMVLGETSGSKDIERRPSAVGTAAAAKVTHPVRIAYEAESLRVGHIEIRDATANHRVVTAIEVLSPANKSNATGRAQYARKREAYVAAATHIVEIDLLRAGPIVVDLPPGYLSKHPEHASPYKCVVRRISNPGWVEIEYYPVSLREQLPCIAIPLRKSDDDTALDLQPLLDRTYEYGRYGTQIDYSQTPEPPLSADDASWAGQILSQPGDSTR